MDFHSLARTRRSIRAFKQDPVPEETLARILETVRVAPSGHNRQPWRFLIVKGSEARKNVMALCNAQKWIADAPIVVVALGWDFKYNRGGWMEDKSMIVDVSIAFTHLMLAARAEGLGTCWIGEFDNVGLKKMFDVPEGWNVVAVSPLGYPAGDPWKEPGKRKPLSEIVTVIE